MAVGFAASVASGGGGDGFHLLQRWEAANQHFLFKGRIKRIFVPLFLPHINKDINLCMFNRKTLRTN